MFEAKEFSVSKGSNHLRRVLPLAAVFALVLSGCSLGERPVMTRIGDLDETGAGEPTGDAEAPLSAEHKLREAAASECFVGEWQADNASFSALLFERGLITSDLIAGKMYLTATLEGQLTTELLNWSFETPTFSIIPSAPQSMPVTTNSTETRDYVLNDDGSFSVDAEGGSSSDSGGPGDETARYYCAGDVLTVSVYGGTATLARQ